MSRAQHAVVIGAGVGGLGTALALSRSGHRVTIVERDATPTPATADAAFDWDRRGAPQVRHSHALLARLHNLLRDRYPDVLADLLATGATEMRFCDNPPAEMRGWSPEPGDDDLVAIACRRTTFEWVLRRTVLAEPGVRLLDGVIVEHLITAPVLPVATTETDLGGPHDPPAITGVHLRRGDVTEALAADLVVAAAGRRSGAVHWLDELGVALPVEEEDTGIIYLSRFYRLRPEAPMPDQNGPIGGDLGYLKYAVFEGDNRTYSVTFAVRTGDTELRALLLDPARFDQAARVLPATAGWAAAGIADPITPVNVMAGLLNRRIRFCHDDGSPRVLGFHAVGDAHTCTNPLYGRGCSLAMVQATLLAEALAAHPDDPMARASAYEVACAREIEPWYKAAVAQDRISRNLERAEHEAATGTAGGDTDGEADAGDAGAAEVTPADFMADIMREGLFPAVRTDPLVFRAFIRAFNLLTAPDALLNDAEVIGRVMAMYNNRESRPPEIVLGPDRAGMLAALDCADPPDPVEPDPHESDPIAPGPAAA